MKIKVFKCCIAVVLCIIMLQYTTSTVVYANDQPIRVSVNGEYISFPDVMPMIINSRVFVPVRSLEQISSMWTINWNADISTVTLTYEAYPFKQIVTIVPESKSIDIINYDRDFESGQYVLSKDNAREQMSFDFAPQIINGRLMIPLRMLENFIWGSIMEWDGDAKTVIITQVAG